MTALLGPASSGVGTQIVRSVEFRRKSKRRPWTCLVCGAAVVDVEQHATWHAWLDGQSERRRPDPGAYVGPKLTVHVRSDGWTIR